MRPLYFPSVAAMEQVRGRLQVALAGWVREWAAHPPAVNVEVGAVVERDRWCGYEYRELRDRRGSVWIRAGAVDRAALERLVVGIRPTFATEALLVEIVEMARAARDADVLATLFGESDAPARARVTTKLPSELFVFGSGAVQISCPALGLQGIANGGVWR